MPERLRLAAIVEAQSVTGPAKNLIRFCQGAQGAREEGLPALEPLLLVFVRGTSAEGHVFLNAAHQVGLKAEPVFEKGRFDTSVLSALRARLVSFRPDVIQTHSVKSHFLVRISGLHRLYPWVAFHHGYTATDWKMKAYNQLDRWSLQAARTIVTVCGPFAQELERVGVNRSKIHILHNSVQLPAAVEEPECEVLRNKLGLFPGQPVVLSIGRFSFEKSQRDLIQAFQYVQRQRPEACLVLVGEGPEQARLQQQTASLGLSRSVIFAGQVSNVQPYYSISDVFALPSLSEGSPNVLLEAMAAAVPIVSTKVGGVGELVDHEINGLLTPASDPVALATAIERILADRTLAQRLARAGQERVVEHFTPEAYRRKLLIVYAQAIAAGV